ncbi:uncharacterized protein LOC106717219 [Papilio machaon]|uniref:uncharacterized protein LOC106717219 n=1 Tax=Papilio machaon TaxID=76193 RepID=UPI001E665718|nr:uncharacterized protein LOC106717219 [Papilio machaon]
MFGSECSILHFQCDGVGHSCTSSCFGLKCVSNCTGEGCETLCRGPECFSTCHSDNCIAYCKGTNCSATCLGHKCSSFKDPTRGPGEMTMAPIESSTTTTQQLGWI